MQQPQWQIKNILKQFEMLNWKYDRYRTPILCCTQEFVEKYFCSQKLKCVEEIKRKIMQKKINKIVREITKQNA